MAEVLLSDWLKYKPAFRLGISACQASCYNAAMVKRIMWFIIKLIISLAVILGSALLIGRLVVGHYASSRLASPAEVEPQRVAIVFGAGLWRNGSPTPVL